jgi:hypothetical protein
VTALRAIPSRLHLPPGWAELLVAAWFVAISLMRIRAMSTTPPGFDGRLYRAATIAWLDGADPWTVFSGPIRYAAPPPSLLAMLPFALVPEDVAVAAIIILGLLGTIWAIRRLGLPIWWIAFPPFIDGLYNANPHVFLVPLLVAGAAPIAVMVKIYAGLVPLVRGQVRAVLLSVGLVLVTAPFLPWAEYLAAWPSIVDALREQSDGGMSALAIPLLIPIGIAALILMGRERAAWWIVPVLWPSTQWYYASMVMPAATLLAAVVVAVPSPWSATVAAALVAGEVVYRRRQPAAGHPAGSAPAAAT